MLRFFLYIFFFSAAFLRFNVNNGIKVNVCVVLNIQNVLLVEAYETCADVLASEEEVG